MIRIPISNNRERIFHKINKLKQHNEIDKDIPAIWVFPRRNFTPVFVNFRKSGLDIMLTTFQDGINSPTSL